MQKLPDFVSAFSHHLKPLNRDGDGFTGGLVHPRIEGGILPDSAVESQQFRSHHGSTFRLRNLSLHSTLTRGTKGRRRSTDCDVGNTEVILSPDKSGGLNGSTQHSSRTRLALKTKAKSLARVRSAGTLPCLGFDRGRPNRSLLPGKYCRINALDGVASTG